MSAVELLAIAVAGFAAGGVNALAGGGSLILFPVLLATGLSPLAANVTNTVAAWPGTAGGVIGFLPTLRGRWRPLLPLALVGALGSATGCALLLLLPSSAFDVVVPVFVLGATLLLALQPRISGWLAGRSDATTPARPARRRTTPRALLALAVAGVYGGYFGGAMGVVLLAALALTVPGDLRDLNAEKSALSLVDCSVGVVAFALLGPVAWAAVAVAAPTGLVGGFLGARLAGRVDERVLRAAVVTIGIAVAVGLALG